MIKRKCAGCGEIKDRSELIRITNDRENGQVIINRNNKIFGRSAYLCYNNTCIEAAFKKNRLAKALKTSNLEDLKGKLTNEF